MSHIPDWLFDPPLRRPTLNGLLVFRGIPLEGDSRAASDAHFADLEGVELTGHEICLILDRRETEGLEEAVLSWSYFRVAFFKEDLRFVFEGRFKALKLPESRFARPEFTLLLDRWICRGEPLV